jgi:tRNA A-37 threonylcarbamoyl transferase component Bud32
MILIKKRWTIFPPWNKAKELASPFESMEKVFNIKGKIISKSPQSEIFSQNIDGKQYFIKRYFCSKGLGSWLGFSRLRVEARNQHWFNQQGIFAAPIVAYGEESFLLKTIKGALITEGVEDVNDLASIADNKPEKFQDKQWRNAMLSDLAEVIEKLHNNRFCHNDLHWRNILIQQKKGKDQLRICLIDCPSGKRLFWPLLNYRRLKDLAALDKVAFNYLSQTQRLRFFMEYRKTRKLTSEDKDMIVGILIHKANRVKRKAKEAAKNS